MPMKISSSIETLYKQQQDNANALKKLLHDRIDSWAKDRGWHYTNRVKTVESYAQKTEQSHHGLIDDVYAGTIIVKNPAEARTCCDELELNCKTIGLEFQYKKPADLTQSSFSADKFVFDSIRMYFKASKPDIGEPDYLTEVFEIQIRTLIDEAWSKASHSFFYKTDEDLSWAKTRLMSQIKALLESAELALEQAQILSQSAILQKEDKQLTELNELMAFFRKNWSVDMLPKDMRRLAQNTQEFLKYSGIKIAELDTFLEAETAQGRGIKTLNLPPYWIVVRSAGEQKGWISLLGTINNNMNRKYLSSKFFTVIKELECSNDVDFDKLIKIRKLT